MRRKLAIALTALLAVAVIASADTLRFRSGLTIEGTFLGADAREIKFLGSDGQPKTYPLNVVEGITFGPSSLPASPAPKPAAAAPAPKPAPTRATVPAGSAILVRMVDSLDTSKTKTGQIFSATLETNLVANGLVVARKGATVHGKVIKAANARRLTGKSELQLELTSIVINGTSHAISTSGFQSKGGGEGKETLKKTAGGAGLGAIIGAIAGDAGKGAAIGAVSGLGIAMVKKGEPIQVPSESLLEFSLKVSTTLPISKG
jgi:hypothetical protein